MDIRKSASVLPTGERDRFLEALIRLKHRPAPNGPPGVSVYDQFTALHGAIFAVRAPGLPPNETINFGHWNIGFCPWHRQYLRVFERALQAEVPGVTVPYWDWSDSVGSLSKLFVPEFLSSLNNGQPSPVTDGVLRSLVPPAERPAWWPNGAQGFTIPNALREGRGASLSRGSAGVSWPPTVAGLARLEQLLVQRPNVHPLWYFWTVLEQGHPSYVSATHNTGHNYIGGHMAGSFSPNDPVFWLHHANVDRLWSKWQAWRLEQVPGSVPADHWPAPDQPSPFDGRPAPLGHRLDDQMWPWVGAAPGYSTNASPQIRAMLPDFSAVAPVTVRGVLDTTTIDAVGYRYE